MGRQKRVNVTPCKMKRFVLQLRARAKRYGECSGQLGVYTQTPVRSRHEHKHAQMTAILAYHIVGDALQQRIHHTSRGRRSIRLQGNVPGTAEMQVAVNNKEIRTCRTRRYVHPMIMRLQSSPLTTGIATSVHAGIMCCLFPRSVF